MVNPAHVRRSKELDDNLLTKHDAKTHWSSPDWRKTVSSASHGFFATSKPIYA
jgi:hypothetical protein